MTSTNRTTVGFITPTAGDSPHFAGFKALIPAEVHMDFEGLEVLRDYSLSSLQGSTDLILERARSATAERGWQGVIVSGAPLEILSPGLQERLQAALPVPATTALTACVAALRSLRAERVLLLTPFDEAMNDRIAAYLTDRGIQPTLPATAFRQIAEAMRLAPEEVRQHALAALAGAGDVQAIYLQGAVLDPLPVLDALERETNLPIVASNPAMLWYMLSRIGLTYSIPGHGQLLREWPLPAY